MEGCGRATGGLMFSWTQRPSRSPRSRWRWRDRACFGEMGGARAAFPGTEGGGRKARRLPDIHTVCRCWGSNRNPVWRGVNSQTGCTFWWTSDRAERVTWGIQARGCGFDQSESWESVHLRWRLDEKRRFEAKGWGSLSDCGTHNEREHRLCWRRATKVEACGKPSVN